MSNRIGAKSSNSKELGLIFDKNTIIAIADKKET